MLRGLARTAVRKGTRGITTIGNAGSNWDSIGHASLTDQTLRGIISAETYQAFRTSIATGSDLSKAQRNEIARAIGSWAQGKGANTFAHLFFPVRGAVGTSLAGLKYNSFVNLDFGAKDWTVPLPCTSGDFGATELFFSETDGSSFPSGGLRQTQEAAAYMSWDRSSPPLIHNNTLLIPSAFVTWSGAAEDEKTPLLRSQTAVNKQATRLMHLCGYDHVSSVVANVGIEQEFFLVDRDQYIRRPDLVATGRTLLGAPANRGQEFDSNYFSEPNWKVQRLFNEFRDACWDLGISAVVAHNEVAPSQHEWSPIFTLVNIAADQNIIAMRIMEEIANKHGLVALLHEKPFDGINGNGKHNNWGLNANNGQNFYVPGKNEKDQAFFIANVACLARAVQKHGDLFRIGIATPANDHRLGAQEAPPAIMSLYLGHALTEHCVNVANGGPLHGYSADNAPPIMTGNNAVLPIPRAAEDRNRTAPLPWCGNRFEFRAVGSSQNVSWPLTLLQTAVADCMSELCGAIEEGATLQQAVQAMMTDGIKAVFTGDCYSQEWQTEAVTQRGLLNLKNTAEAIPQLVSDKNKEVFSRMGVFEPFELDARLELVRENYVKSLHCEARTLVNMLNTGVIPALSRDLNAHNPALVGNRETLYKEVAAKTEALEATLAKLHSQGNLAAETEFCSTALKEAMQAVRDVADTAEGKCAGDVYPFPTYTELLHNHHSEW